jgi:hypothetical protein
MRAPVVTGLRRVTRVTPTHTPLFLRAQKWKPSLHREPVASADGQDSPWD